MAKTEVSDSPASLLFSDFVNRHLALGTGNHGNALNAVAFASLCNVSQSRVSEWRHRRGGLPGLSSLQLIESAFFPKGTPKNLPAYAEWEAVKKAILNPAGSGEYEPDQKRFSLREVWGLLMRPLADRTIPLVRSAAGQDRLDGERIRGRLLDRAFILPMPDWFGREIKSDPWLADQYDIHPPCDFSGDPSCAAFFDAIPVRDIRDIVTWHSRSYARQVLDALRQRPAYPPFNKKKLGLHGYQQLQRSGAREGIYLDLDFYLTDYHTHSVMHRVLHDIRASHPALFRDDAAPFEALPHLRYFTTSFGLNVIATTQENNGKRFYMTRLSHRQGNANQQGLWHVTANEGLNLDDVRNGAIDLHRVVDRALCEEMGTTVDPAKDETIYLEFAIDRRNLEPFISCLVHLAIDRQTFYQRKHHLARDDRREFDHTSDFPFSEQAIIRLLLDEPSGAEAFTSYGLNILDSLLVRQLTPVI